MIRESAVLLSLAALYAASAVAQITTNQFPNEPVPPPALEWRAAARDACSTTHEARELITNSVSGEVTDRTRRYIEVASGLNYLNDAGEYVPSEDLIELTADGGAAALRGPAKVRFNANLNTIGAISITTQSNRVFKTRPLAVVLRNAESGRVALLALLQDCVAELLPPNQLVYRGAFGALADIRLTYTKAAVESDLILLQQPKLPEGWDAKTARLELWHEWLGAPTPRQTARPIYREADEALRQKMVDPDVEDQILDFGDLWFPTGAAFATDAKSARGTNEAAQVRVPNLTLDTNLLAVAKSWLSATSRNVLVETLRWEDVQPKLNKLPSVTQAGALARAQNRTECLNRLPAAGAANETGQSIRLAESSYSPVGVVLDYIMTVPASGGSWYFGPGYTYYISSQSTFSSTVAFYPGVVIKYAPSASLVCYGNVLCFGSGASPTVLTSKDDDVFGETVPGSLHCPSSYAAYPALLYMIPDGSTACSISGLKIRWADIGVEVHSYYPSCSPSVTDCNFEFCNYGVIGAEGECNVSANKCNVQVPYCGSYGGDVYFNDVCAGAVDADQNGLADVTEYQYFGGLGTLPGHVIGQLTARTSTHTPPDQWSPHDEVIWSDRNDAWPGTYQWNSSCWLSGVTGLSAFSPYHDDDGVPGGCETYQGGGTLITPRHAVTITHMSGCFFQGSRFIRFKGTDGSVHNVRVIACQTFGSPTIATDMVSARGVFELEHIDDTCVLLLETNLPPSVPYARVLPSSMTGQPWVKGYTSCRTGNLPVVGFNQLKHAFIADCYQFSYSGFYPSYGAYHHSVWFPTWMSWWWLYPPQPAQCFGDAADVQGGDSGSPTWLLINNELVLIGVWRRCGNSTFIGASVNQVNGVIASLDTWYNSWTGYTVTQYQ